LPEFGLEWSGISSIRIFVDNGGGYGSVWNSVLSGEGNHRESRECRERGRENLHGCGYGGLNLVNKKRARMIERVSLEMGCKGLIVQLGVSKLLFAGDEVETVPAR
jgi:hypothetical protein